MINLLNSKPKKIIASVLVGVIAFAFIGIATYTLARQILPSKDTQNEKTISDPKTADTTFKEAVSAEEKGEYSKAQKLYEEALPYYKAEGEDSIANKNKAYGIEARITAMKDQQAAYDKYMSEQNNNPAIQFDEPKK